MYLKMLRLGMGQEKRGGVREDVQMAKLLGHGYGSAVCLVHLDSLERKSGRRLTDEGDMNPPGVYRSKRRCYHRRSVNVL